MAIGAGACRSRRVAFKQMQTGGMPSPSRDTDGEAGAPDGIVRSTASRCPGTRRRPPDEEAQTMVRNFELMLTEEAAQAQSNTSTAHAATSGVLFLLCTLTLVVTGVALMM